MQAVGASGAIFGMVGAWAAFCIMNETVLGRNYSQGALRNVAQTVMINVVYGMSSSQIDNMGHLGVSEFALNGWGLLFLPFFHVRGAYDRM